MSADNWAECPQCERNREAAITLRERQIADLYGSVPMDEFDAARADLTALCEQKLDHTLREDYEVGIFNGEFFVQYKGFCKQCNFGHDFETSYAIKLEEKA